MKKIISLILCIMMLVTALPLSAVSASGNTYYIDSIDGDNGNSGRSPEEAWRDLGGFTADKLGAGDTVLFRRGGTYECAVTLQDIHGTKDASFVISSWRERKTRALHRPSRGDIHLY